MVTVVEEPSTLICRRILWTHWSVKLGISLLILAVSSCSSVPRSWHNESASGKVVDSTIPVPDFSIKVMLSEQARKRLSDAKEGVLVSAMFDGDALPGKGKYNPPMRDVVLGSDEKPIDRLGVASFRAVKIRREDWNNLSDRNYFVTINIYSARRAFANNILDCPSPEDRITTFAGKETEVSCRLIDER